MSENLHPIHHQPLRSLVSLKTTNSICITLDNRFPIIVTCDVKKFTKTHVSFTIVTIRSRAITNSYFLIVLSDVTRETSGSFHKSDQQSMLSRILNQTAK